MAWENSRAAILCAFTMACGGHEKPHRLEQPTLETIESSDDSKGGGTGESLGKDAAFGFLRPCKTLVSAGGLVELRCDAHQLVEFRKVASGTSDADADLDDLVALLKARFGGIREERRDAQIDSNPVRVSTFRGVKTSKLAGLAVVIGNVEGQYWSLACYRDDGPANIAFCGDAIATAARAGGLAHVEAQPIEEFGEGRVRVPEGCELVPGRRIHCDRGELSWSGEAGRDAQRLRDETIASLRKMAVQEKVDLRRKEKFCKLLGVSAECVLIELRNREKKEQLNFLVVTGGDQERLVVCSFPGSAAAPLPKPCAQAIELEER